MNVYKMLVVRVGNLKAAIFASVIMLRTNTATYNFPFFCISKNIDFNIFF